MEGVVIVGGSATVVWWGLGIVRRRFCGDDKYPRQLLSSNSKADDKKNSNRSEIQSASPPAGLSTLLSGASPSHPALVISGDSLTALAFLFAATGLLATLVLSLVRNFEQVTSTHCSKHGFHNFAPSVSACIGDFALQRTVWSVAVACYVPPRLATAWVVYHLSLHVPLRLARLRLLLFVFEHLSLVLLTVVTSSVNATVHQLGFALFALFSMLSMASHCLLGGQPGSCARAADKAAYRWRRGWAVANGASFVLAMFWFVVHNYFACAHYMYSFFAICEWLFVLTNVGFHCVELIDLRDHQVHISRLQSTLHRHPHPHRGGSCGLGVHSDNSKVHQ
jgi:hypothetical protein